MTFYGFETELLIPTEDGVFTSTSLPVVSSLFGCMLLLIVTFLMYMAYLYVRLSVLKSKKPFMEIPTVPHVHWLFGHFPYFHTIEPSSHHETLAAYASPSGIVGIWGDLERRGFTVLRADHVRAVLRQNSSRDPMKLITRHGVKTLGADSLILIPGGMRWKKQRSTVAKMFTVDIVRGGKKAVADCSQVVVRWLLDATSPRALNKKCRAHDGECVYMEAENLFKLYSLEVFGKVSMGYEFKCFEEEPTTEHVSQSCDDKYCQCLKMSEMANSFAFLQDDVAKRSQPKNVFNPTMQSYSLPTKYNRDYARHCNVVRDMMGEIIGKELDKILSVKNIAQVYGMENEKRKECQGDANLVTHLLRSTLEDKFHVVGGSSKPAASRVASCPMSGSKSNTTGCPFANSSTTLPPGSMDSVPNSMTASQKQECIHNVSGILRTLLMAGFETSAVSLSYAMYFLSHHPRCQELCAQEADRVLGSRNEDVTYDTDFDADDLVYCKAFIQETIRLHLPVTFTTRVLEKDMSFDTGNGDERLQLPKGTKALISPSAVHHDERNFERAKEFIPERWVRWDGDKWVNRNYEKERNENAATTSSVADTTVNPPVNPESISAANPQNFFSFSDGARNCVGKRLAILETSVLIGFMLRDFKVDIAEEDFELTTKRKFATVGPVRLPVVFKRR